MTAKPRTAANKRTQITTRTASNQHKAVNRKSPTSAAAKKEVQKTAGPTRVAKKKNTQVATRRQQMSACR